MGDSKRGPAALLTLSVESGVSYVYSPQARVRVRVLVRGQGLFCFRLMDNGLLLGFRVS